MAEEEAAGEFAKQFSGSAAANGITLLVLGVLYARVGVTALHTCCLDIDITDKSQTVRSRGAINQDGPEGSKV